MAAADTELAAELTVDDDGTPEAPDTSQATIEQPVVAAEPAKAAKAKRGKKDKKAADGGEAAAGGEGPSIAAHPRAVRGVARAKAWGAIAGFVLGGYLSLPTHTLADAALRALIAGVVCHVVAWAAAVFVWRRLVMLELRARQQQLALAGQPRRPDGAAGGRGRE